MNGELVSPAMVIVCCFLCLFLIIGAAVFLFTKLKLKDETARRIEIIGYFLLFVVLVWELLFKNIFNGDFYNADSFYLNKKLSVLFQMLTNIINDTKIETWKLSKYFYGLETTDYLKVQLLTIDIIESVLKILSTVFIAVGRFQELKKKKTEDKCSEITKTYTKQNISNNKSIDRSIPYYNLILKCDKIHISSVPLPESYHFKMYDEGNEKHWAALECEIGDFSSFEEAEAYFKANYSNQIDELKKRCVFVVDNNDNVVGSCIAWKDSKRDNTVASLHWLVVSPKHQGKHIGLALCQKVMEIFNEFGEVPVYIHTQPWSYKAILLYTKLGFKIQKTDTFSHYENQYEQAIKTLENLLTEEQFNKLISATE